MNRLLEKILVKFLDEDICKKYLQDKGYDIFFSSKKLNEDIDRLLKIEKEKYLDDRYRKTSD